MGNAWERYKNSRAYQENKEERRALSQTLAARDQALRQTGEEVDARIQAQRQGGGFSAGSGAGRELDLGELDAQRQAARQALEDTRQEQRAVAARENLARRSRGFTLEDAESYEAEKEPLRRRVEAAETDIENVDTLERYSQLRRKDDFGGQFLASYDMGRLGQDEAKAWSDYLSNPTESNRAYAEGLGLARELFAEHNAAVLDEDATLPLISQSMAGYLPQFLDQTAAGVQGALVGAGAGSVLPGIGTVAGGKVGYAAGRAFYGYRTMQGMAFQSLLEAGVDEETARAAANDEALISSLIEGGDAAIDMMTLGIGKGLKALLKKPAQEAAGSVGRKIASVLAKYGINVASEGAQEWVQEGVSAANQGRDGSGVLNLVGETTGQIGRAVSGRDPEALARMNEAGMEGLKIGALMGGAGMLGNQVVNAGLERMVASHAQQRDAQGPEARADVVIGPYDGRGNGAVVKGAERDNAEVWSTPEQAETGADSRRVSNRQAEQILADPEALAGLRAEAGLELSDGMTRAQQRAAVKSAVERLTGRTDRVQAGEDAGGHEGRPYAEARSAREQGNSELRRPENRLDAVQRHFRRSSEQLPVAEGAERDRRRGAAAEARTGTEARADVGGESESTAARLKEAGSAFGRNGARALTAAYDGEMALDRYYGGFAAYYQAGLSGRGMDGAKGPYTGALNEAQRFAAYSAGRNDGLASLAREKRAAQFAPSAGNGSGLVFDGYVSDTLDGATANRVNQVAKALGVRVRFADSVRGGTANAQLRGADILVEKGNPNPVLFLLGHEWTHRLQELAPEAYRSFRNFASEELQGEAQVLLEGYRQAGEDIGYEAALDEAAANYAGKLLEDGKLLDSFIEKHRDDRTLLEKVRDAIRAVVRRLTGAEKRQAQTAEEKLTAALEAGARQARRLQKRQSGGTMESAKYSVKDLTEHERAALLAYKSSESYKVNAKLRDGLALTDAEQKLVEELDRALEKLPVHEGTVYRRLSFDMEGQEALDTFLAEHEEDGFVQYPAFTSASTTPDGYPVDSRLSVGLVLESVGGRDLAGYGNNFENEVLFPRGSRFIVNRVDMASGGEPIIYMREAVRNGIARSGGWVHSEERSQTMQRVQKAPQGDIHLRGVSGLDSGRNADGQVPVLRTEGEGGEVGRASLKGSEDAAELAELRRENERLKERVEEWKGQTRRTAPGTVDRKAVDRAARELIRAYGSELEASDLSGGLKRLYDYMGTGRDGRDELTWTEARRRAEELAGMLVDSAVETDDSLYRQYGELRDYLRGAKLTISEQDAAGLRDYDTLRRHNFGRMSLGKGGTNIDQVYEDLAERWPEFFDAQRETHPADQLEHISDVLDDIYRMEERNPFAQYRDQAVDGAAGEILETFFDLPQVKTFADRQAAKLEKAKAKGRQQVQQAREQRDARLAALREQNRARVQRAIERERETRTRQVGALKERYQARDAAGRERRSAAELRRKIARHAKGLSQKLLRPSDKKHVPENLRGPVAALLESINQESQYTIDPETGSRRKGGGGLPAKRTEAFRVLKEQYEAIQKGTTDFTGVVDPALADNLTALIAMKDTPLAAMNTEQLAIVWNTLKAVEASVSSANKLFTKGRYDGVAELAQAIKDSARTKRAKANYGGGGLGAVTGFGDQLLNLDMLDSLTFLHLFGEGGDALYHELQAARDRKTIIIRQTRALVKEVIGKADIRKLQETSHTFQVEGGELKLTTAQLMSLYELSKREQAQDHIYIGGLRPAEHKKAASLAGKLEAPADGVKVSQEDVAEMLSALTDEEVKLADGLQGIMQGYLADEGNRESMKVYNYRKFTEEHYFPITSDPHQVQTKIGDILEGGQLRPVSVAEWGSAKGTVEKASNGLLLGDIFDVFAQHAVDMSTYASHLGVLEDLNRVRNFTFRDSEGNRTGSIGDIIQRVAGQGGGAYLDKLLQDISRGTAKGGVAGLSRLTANYKAASVGLNLRVVLQQPTSYARALAVMDPKYLADPRVMKGGGWEKALKYAPIAQWKDWGNFEINQGRQIQDILFGTDSGLEQTRNRAMGLASAMDSWTWGRLWNACELEIADQRPGLTRGSEAFYRAVAQRFTDVVDQTQVVDNVLGRSQFMRSSDGLAKMASSYMGEPTKTYNLFYRTYRDAVQEQDPQKRVQARKRMGRTAGALVFSMFLNAIVQSLWDAVRDDDDRDEKYWERVLGHIGPNFAQNVNPLGMVPYLRDILSILQGYDVERMDLSAVASFFSAVQNMGKAINGEGRYTVLGAGANLLAELARLTGLPVATVKRDALAVARTIGVETEDWRFQYQLERALNSVVYSGNRKEFYDIAFGALRDGDTELYQEIAADLMRQGVKASAIENAMRQRLEETRKENPDFSMPEEARDLIGSYETYAKPKESTSGFSAEALDAENYQAYAAQAARQSREWVDTLESYGSFHSLDDEAKDGALEAARQLAEDMALRSYSGGQFTDADLSQWERWATGGEEWGVDPVEAILFKTAYDMAESDKDEDGKTISGSKKENALEAAEKLLPGLTGGELEYLMANFWTPEDRELKEMKESKFMP